MSDVSSPADDHGAARSSRIYDVSSPSLRITTIAVVLGLSAIVDLYAGLLAYDLPLSLQIATVVVAATEAVLAVGVWRRDRRAFRAALLLQGLFFLTVLYYEAALPALYRFTLVAYLFSAGKADWK